MTSTVVRLPLAPASKRAPAGLAQLERYLHEQQQLSAVDRFAQHHARGASPDGPRGYRALIPLEAPAAGEQYAFRVDLDACTGCKACVTACHSLNGLDDGETWRAVGLLHGGSPALPVQQAVTTTCHHCVEPACLLGCPVAAYEKDTITGIVKHLDDQCIGCQYCTFTCPYDVPQFNASLGIVRKCDMCSDRLAASEAPACAQACPSEAITITLVEQRQAASDAQRDAFLPGAPSPAITIPTTRYDSERTLPRNLLPADFYTALPSPRHPPLVLMLVLTQLSVGALWASAAFGRFLPEGVIVALRPLHALVAVSIGLAAMAASVLHLGRPLYAFRAVLGLRTSWMSREILALGLFAPLAVAYAAACFHARAAPSPHHRAEDVLGALVAATGLVSVTCSVLVYHATRRPWWGAPLVGFKFFFTTVVLGLATTMVTLSVGAARLGDAATTQAVAPVVATAARLLALATLIKLGGELLFFRHLGDLRFTPLKRSAVLMKDDLRGYTLIRFAAGLAGGVVLPLLGRGMAAAAVGFALLAAGELVERTLFFAAVSSPGMPGGSRG
jgi:formate dehydrogenase iron-sulfur subunit